MTAESLSLKYLASLQDDIKGLTAELDTRAAQILELRKQLAITQQAHREDQQAAEDALMLSMAGAGRDESLHYGISESNDCWERIAKHFHKKFNRAFGWACVGWLIAVILLVTRFG
jgi:hypothetical protein